MEETESLTYLMIAAPFIFTLVAVAWILLPFAVFGVKGLLRDVKRELEKANRHLDDIYHLNEYRGREQ